ncbi:MAG: AsmA-like C-terminal region-containing protein, partial [Flavobacteriaceae bacterium]
TDPLALMGTGTSGFTASLNPSLGQLKLEGSANTPAEFQYTGTADLRSGKLRALLSWLHVPVGAGPGLNDVALTANVNLVGSNAALSSLKMRVDETNAEGALKIGRTGALTIVQGTLAADAVDLDRYRPAAPEGAASGGGQPVRANRTVDLSALKGFDIDLRLSAASVKLGKAAITRSAISLTAREGKFQIAVGEADVFGGKASGTISGSTAGSGNLPMTTSFQAKGLLAAPVLEALGLPPRLTGKIDATLSADGDGANGARFMRSMNGQAKIDISGATLSGVDLKRAVELILNPARTTQTQASNQTALTSINGTFTIRDGVSTTNDLVLAGNQLKIGVNGSHDIPSGRLEGSGLAEVGAAGGAGQTQLAIPFRLGGTISAPQIAPDAAWLLDLNNPESRQKLQDTAKTLLKNGIGKLFERNK